MMYDAMSTLCIWPGQRLSACLAISILTIAVCLWEMVRVVVTIVAMHRYRIVCKELPLYNCLMIAAIMLGLIVARSAIYASMVYAAGGEDMTCLLMFVPALLFIYLLRVGSAMLRIKDKLANYKLRHENKYDKGN